MTEQEGAAIADEIRNMLRRLVIATSVLYVLIIVTMVVGFYAIKHQADDIKHQADSTNAALCTFKNDLAQRADQTEAFIKTHPEGFAGIPASTLEAQAKSQKATVKSLSQLDCP